MGIGVCGGIEGGKYKNSYKGGWVGEWSPEENMKSIYRGWVKKNIEDIENHFKGH